MKVYYPKLYNMAQLLALNVLLLPKDITIIFIHLFIVFCFYFLFIFYHYYFFRNLTSITYVCV